MIIGAFGLDPISIRVPVLIVALLGYVPYRRARVLLPSLEGECGIVAIPDLDDARLVVKAAGEASDWLDAIHPSKPIPQPVEAASPLEGSSEAGR